MTVCEETRVERKKRHDVVARSSGCDGSIVTLGLVGGQAKVESNLPNKQSYPILALSRGESREDSERCFRRRRQRRLGEYDDNTL